MGDPEESPVSLSLVFRKHHLVTTSPPQETILCHIDGVQHDYSRQCWGPLKKVGLEDLKVGGLVGDKDGCQGQAGCVLVLGSENGSFREGCALGLGVHACTCDHAS